MKDVLPAVLVELKQLGAGEEGEEQEPKKATVTFVRGQLAWLDRSAAAMMLRTGQSIDRGQLIRAILGAVRAAGVDLADCWSEADIRDRLTRWIHAGMAAEEAADRAQE